MTNTTKTDISAPVHVTDDGEACSGQWVAALVQTNCERRVAERLGGLSFETYVASQEELHRWSDRVKKVQRMVIPNIVFVRTAKDRYPELKAFTFVRGLLSQPGDRQPAVIPDKQMKTLQFMLGQNDSPVYLENSVRHLVLGGKVRVQRGSFAGLEGTICRLRDGDLHVGIQLDNLGFAHVSIHQNDIQEISNKSK